MTWRRPTPEDRAVAAIWFVSAASVLALRPFWPVVVRFLPPCVFRTWTGWPCPTCGTTRSAIALLRGDVWEGLAANPLAGGAGIVFLLGGGVVPIWVLLRAPIPVAALPPWWLRCALAAAIANWIWVAIRGG